MRHDSGRHAQCAVRTELETTHHNRGADDRRNDPFSRSQTRLLAHYTAGGGTGTVNISLTGLSSASAVGTPTLSPGAASITLTLSPAAIAVISQKTDRWFL